MPDFDGEPPEINVARQAWIHDGPSENRDAFHPHARRGDAEDFLGQFADVGEH